jgi:4,5-DOPA dioxygenase extradiol
MYPQADTPIVQLSLDERQPPQFHHALGARLRPLRAEGVLLLGSGDVVHNLHTYAWGRHPQEPYDWALRFEARVRAQLSRGEHGGLIDYAADGPDALLAVPTPEHYLPLLYVLGASLPGEAVSFPVTGMDGGSVSMLAVQFGV